MAATDKSHSKILARQRDALIEATLQRYAAEAGFRRVEVLPIERFFLRFYRLYP
jgi:hypothetical protein